MSDVFESDSSHPATRRKRVIAREIEAANLDASAITPSELAPLDVNPAIPIHPIQMPIAPSDPVAADSQEPIDPTPVVDPTLLGRRHRRSSHQAIYRWTQFWTLMSASLAALSLLCTMVSDQPGELTIARIFAGGAIVAAMVAYTLSGRNSLSERWRGWAIAALVFSVVSLGLTWLHAHIVTTDYNPPSPVPSVQRDRR